MTEYLNSLGNAIVDRSPEELIGAVAIALIISLAMAGLYCIGRRKVTDNLMPMIVLMLVANLVSMAVGAGYFGLARRRMGSMQHDLARRPLIGPGGAHEFMTQWIFREADRNRDRQISGEEASVAAANFLRIVDATGKGSIDPRTLDRALQGLMFNGRNPGHPPPPRPFVDTGGRIPDFPGPRLPPNPRQPAWGPPTEQILPATDQPQDPADTSGIPDPKEAHVSG